jgi:hypothetical protein
MNNLLSLVVNKELCQDAEMLLIFKSAVSISEKEKVFSSGKLAN